MKRPTGGAGPLRSQAASKPVNSGFFDVVLVVSFAAIVVFVFLLVFSLGMLPAIVILGILTMLFSTLPDWTGWVFALLITAGGLAAVCSLYKLAPPRVWKGVFRNLKGSRDRRR